VSVARSKGTARVLCVVKLLAVRAGVRAAHKTLLEGPFQVSLTLDNPRVAQAPGGIDFLQPQMLRHGRQAVTASWKTDLE
jgi:hypothetical protein